MDHKGKIKDNEKIDKYLDLAKELKKKLGNIRVISIVVSVFETVSKGLKLTLEELEIKERIKTIKSAQKSPEDMRKLCYRSNSSERPPARREIIIIVTWFIHWADSLVTSLNDNEEIASIRNDER